MHSVWSDGSQTLDEIVAAGLERGYQFSAVTDHSYGLPIAGGVSMAELEQQHRDIDRLNQIHRGRFRLLKGIEANIRADGALDMTVDELRQLEIVVAAPHSTLRSPADQTARMVNAVDAPACTSSAIRAAACTDRGPASRPTGIEVFARGGAGERRDRNRRRSVPAGSRLRPRRTRGEGRLSLRARQRRPFDRRAALRGNRDRARAAGECADRPRDQLLAARSVAGVGGVKAGLKA